MLVEFWISPNVVLGPEVDLGDPFVFFVFDSLNFGMVGFEGAGC